MKRIGITRATQLGLLTVAVVLASLPALLGTWVYDDRLTASSEFQDGWDDLAAVFSRDASDYFEAGSDWSTGVTYRPLSMASLIAVQALDPELPLVHHLVSLLLHLVCVFGLYVVATRIRADETSNAPLLIAAAFALHPVGVEAYGWINGRSDVLAGAFVSALACALSFDAKRVSHARLAATGLAAAGAALSKEPAVVAVAAILLTSLLPPVGLPDRDRFRALWPSQLAGVIGLSCALGIRWWVTQAHPSGAAGLLRDPELVPRFSQLLSLAIEHAVVPLPRAMLSLAFELSHPPRIVDWVALGALAVSCVALAAVGRLRMVVLLGAALLCLVTVLPVSRMLWLGFDRYLYLPMLMLCLGVAQLRIVVPSDRRRLVQGLVMGALLVSLAASFVTARAYASHRVWLKSLLDSRPDDASGYILTARFFMDVEDPGRARASLLRAPQTRLPPALAHELIGLLMRVGETRVAVRVAEQTFRSYPDDAYTLLDAFASRAMQGRFEDVAALGVRLAQHPVQCRAGLAMLDKWLRSPDLADADKRRLERVVEGIRCP